MDPLSATASLVTVLELLKEAVEFVKAATGAKKEREKLRLEIRDCASVLERLKDEAEDSEEGQAWKATISALEAPSGPLDCLAKTMNSLNAELRPKTGLRKAISILKWPFDVKAVEKTIKLIEREKSLLNIALLNDSRKLAQSISKHVRENGHQLEEVISAIKGASDLHSKQLSEVTERIGSLNISQANMAKTLDDLNHRDGQREAKVEYEAMLEWLSPIDFSARHHDLTGIRQPLTCQWFLDSDEYQSWLQADSETLFCHGIPGAGKTILAATCIDDIIERVNGDSDVGVAYFYCDFNQQAGQKAEGIFANLLKQLLQVRSHISHDTALYKTYSDKRTRLSLAEILEDLQKAIASYSKVFIIIDALDECQSSDGRLTVILDELFKIQALSAINILATSRNIPHITEKFEYSIMFEISSREEDVERYLDGNVFRMPKCIQCNSELQQEVKTAILEATRGMFLLARLHLDSLIGKTSPKAVRKTLKNLPSGVKAYDQAYRMAIERIEAQSSDEAALAKRALLWVVSAKRPLSASQLQHALAVEDDEDDFDNENITEPDLLVSLCAGLISINSENDLVQLVHFTAQEYLERNKEHLSPTAELDITKACITYLLFDNVMRQKSVKTKERLPLFPFWSYAAKYWVYHARDTMPGSNSFVNQLIDSSSMVPAECLVRLARKKEEDVVMWLLDRDVNVNLHDNDWRTPLHYAVLHGWTDCVQLLLNRGAEVKADFNNLTPLHYTVHTGCEKIAQIMLDANVPVDLPINRKIWSQTSVDGQVSRSPVNDPGVPNTAAGTVKGLTALHYATLTGSEKMSTFFLQQGADPGVPNTIAGTVKGLTALHYATLTGSKKMSNFFLQHGADPNATSDYGETPLHLAVKRDISGPRRGLVSEDGWNLLEYRIEICLDSIEIDSDNEADYWEMKASVEDQRLDILELLLNHDRTNVAVVDFLGNSLLHCIQYGTAECHEVLNEVCKKDINVSLRDKEGRTPLHLACSRGDSEAVAVLIDHGANVFDLDKDGLNALHYAAKKGCETTMRLVARSCAVTSLDISATRDIQKQNALHHLFRGRTLSKIEAAQYLLDIGVDLNEFDGDGNSPIMIVTQRLMGDISRKAKMVEFLFQNGADPSSKTPEGLNLGHLSAKSDRLDAELLKVLAQYGVDLQAWDVTGHNILHHCAMKGSLTEDGMAFLCNEIGLSPDTCSDTGKTPMDIVIEMKEIKRHPESFRRNRWSETEQLLLSYKHRSGNNVSHEAHESGTCDTIPTQLEPPDSDAVAQDLKTTSPPKSRAQTIRDGWGTLKNFQDSYGLSLSLEDIEEGECILDALMKVEQDLE